MFPWIHPTRTVRSILYRPLASPISKSSIQNQVVAISPPRLTHPILYTVVVHSGRHTIKTMSPQSSQIQSPSYYQINTAPVITRRHLGRHPSDPSQRTPSSNRYRSPVTISLLSVFFHDPTSDRPSSKSIPTLFCFPRRSHS